MIQWVVIFRYRGLLLDHPVPHTCDISFTVGIQYFATWSTIFTSSIFIASRTLTALDRHTTYSNTFRVVVKSNQKSDQTMRFITLVSVVVKVRSVSTPQIRLSLHVRLRVAVSDCESFDSDSSDWTITRFSSIGSLKNCVAVHLWLTSIVVVLHGARIAKNLLILIFISLS